MEQSASVTELRQLERLYSNDPQAYRWRVRRLVWLGYGYIALCLTVILGFVAGGIALFASGKLRLWFAADFLRIAIPAVALAGLMARGLFVRIPPPEGHYLAGDLKQAVLDWVEPVREATGGCRIDEVLVVDEINAAVQQRPKWGLFGPTRNSLMIGMPLLELLDPDELKAVVAHEFGHLSHAHGRMGATVYRIDHTLRHTAMAIEQKATSGLAEWAFKFFRWFYPRFDTVTFAMRRGQEYEADRVAMRATSAGAIAASLCRLRAIGGAWSAYWGQVWSQARETAENARVQPHQGFQEEFPRVLDADVAAAAVRAALEEETSYEDTHPSLRDRLAALGTGPVDRALPSTRALDAIFSPEQRQRLIEDLDRVWQQESAQNWSERHQEYIEAAATLASLDARRAALDEQETLQLARLEEVLAGEEAALRTVLALAERLPDSADARFHLGCLQLDRDPEASERAFLECLERDLEWLPEVMRYIGPRYEQLGRDLKDSPFARHVESYQAQVAHATAERESVDAEEAFVPPQLTEEQRGRLREQLAAHPEIRTFDLVEKEVEFFSGHRVFVMGIDLDMLHDNVEVNGEKWLERVGPILSDCLPQPHTHFTVLLRKKSPWIYTFAGVEGARLFAREVAREERSRRLPKTAYGLLALLLLVGMIGYSVYSCVKG